MRPAAPAPSSMPRAVHAVPATDSGEPCAGFDGPTIMTDLVNRSTSDLVYPAAEAAPPTMSNDTTLLLLLVLPFAASVVAAVFPTNARNAEAWLAGSVALAGLILAGAGYPAIADGAVMRAEVEWLPSLGLNFTLRMDGFAWMFTVLVTGIGVLVVLYARYYMSPDDPVARFFSYLLGFMGAMLGIVLSGNLIQLVFFWELTSLYSFLLIGYWHHNASARDGARMALTVTSTGGFCLFVGVLMLGHIVGSYDLDRVLASGDLIRSHDLYLPALILILLGALDQERAVSLPFLAAAGDGGADAGLGLSAFGDHGEGRRLPARPPVAGPRGHRRLVLDRRHGRPDHLRARRLPRDLPAGPEGPAGLLDDQPSRPDHAAARPRQPVGGGGGDLPHDEPCHVQGVLVHGCRPHRPRDRHPRHAAPERPVSPHADHGDPGHGRRRRHGGGPPAQRLPVQGDVLRRDHRPSRRIRCSTTRCPMSRRWRRCSASPTRCASFTACSSARRRPICRAPRTGRRCGCWCRSGSSCWPAWSSASSRASRSGRFSIPPCARCWARRLPPTASGYGTASPCRC